MPRNPPRNVSALRRAKYALLSRLPGRRGLHYAWKLRTADAEATDAAFRAAVAGAAGKVCVDLGANLGVYTRLMAESAGKVYAFEPDPWTAARLRENLADLSNVEVIEAAAGAADGTVALYREPRFDEDPETRSESSSTLAAKRNVDAERAVEVAEVDFARWLRDLGEEVAVLKIDIEGGEVALLERLLDSDALGRLGHVFVETHESRIPELAARTAALRARVAGIERPHFNLDWR